MLATSVHPPPNVSNDVNDHSFLLVLLVTGSFPKDIIGGWGALFSLTYSIRHTLCRLRLHDTGNIIFRELL